MSYEMQGAGTPVDETCRYGTSRLHFRGPKRDLSRAFIACLGGHETFGKFVRQPYPAILEQNLGRACVNLGSLHCGLDAILEDPELVSLAVRSDGCVIQMPGAQNISNRLYRVHPRRNDRFLQASDALVELYPEVDFTEFNFNKHLLTHLLQRSAARFERVRCELQHAWLRRMHQLLASLDGLPILLWLRYAGPSGILSSQIGPEPLLVSKQMVDSLADQARDIVEVHVRTAGESDELGDMIFGTLQEPAAEHMIGPDTHRIIAETLLRSFQ
ncbi:MAG: DUF6473 family protein [Pseudomonadota bacterium]